MNILTRGEQKQLAVMAMRQLKIDANYIRQFQKHGIITQFIKGIGYYIDEQTECNLLQKIQEVEKATGVCVYAVTHEQSQFGELFSMLCISKYQEDTTHMLTFVDGNEFGAFAWVYNVDDEWCSEFGSIGVECCFGGIRRIY